eukprot:4655-Eustigmatos_ZCMA.PRE.1
MVVHNYTIRVYPDGNLETIGFALVMNSDGSPRELAFKWRGREYYDDLIKAHVAPVGPPSRSRKA